MEIDLETLLTVKVNQRRICHVPMTVQEACAYLKMPVSTFYYKIKKDSIPVIKQGKHLYIYRDELDKWLEASRKTSVPLTYEEENEAMYSSHHRKPNPKKLVSMETATPIEDLAQVATRWQDTMLSLGKEYKQEPEVLKIGGVPVGTLGNFSASIGKAKAKRLSMFPLWWQLLCPERKSLTTQRTSQKERTASFTLTQSRVRTIV